MTAPTALLDTLIDALLLKRDEQTVRAMFEARVKRRWRQQSDAQLSFTFPQRKSDDDRFAQVMATFDERLRKANERKRLREAEEEAKRSATAAKRKKTPEQVMQEMIARGSTAGRILTLFQRQDEWTTERITTELQVDRNRVNVALHDLVTRDFLIREQPGLYRGIKRECLGEVGPEPKTTAVR